MPTHRTFAVVFAALVVFAACGEEDPIDKVPDEWSPEAVARIEAIAGELAESSYGYCSDLGVWKTSDYVLALTSLQKAKEIPDIVGSCSAGEDGLEIVLFEDAEHREAFVAERQKLICATSKKEKIGVPGLRFTVGPDWSIQTDTQAVALDIVDVLGGEYQMRACGDVDSPDWDSASIARIEALAAAMNDAGITCTFEVEDKDITRKQQHFGEVGLPGALGSCDADFGGGSVATVRVAGFAADSAQPTDFIPLEQGEMCSGGADVRVAVGEGWAAFVATPELATRLAEALDGSVSEQLCQTAPIATTTTSATSTSGASTTSANSTQP